VSGVAIRRARSAAIDASNNDAAKEVVDAGSLRPGKEAWAMSALILAPALRHSQGGRGLANWYGAALVQSHPSLSVLDASPYF
jgi:hypothetical protein